MVVLSITACPTNLRGDLTKWLLEISAGVYVGQIGARVRENLWNRVKTYCKTGKAVLVYPAKNEQGLAFETHGEAWVPIDFDGIKLMLRPNENYERQNQPVRHGFSNAAKYQRSKRYGRK